ncbi:5556_t:CDS:2 [Diversispora eburnea]|uniref:Nuclear movement protein nudC n=1 Tax=Diversispora eburnea TaxID=1213867 RepID=A0A9N8V2Z2_9GLOM|nr:5556_t:CDS:2 [Diversispora eburnea]
MTENGTQINKTDYDSMTPEEQKEHDRLLREKEEAEQAALPYKWKQTLQEVDITIPVPKGTRGRDVIVTIKKKNLLVGLKGQPPIIEGELCKEVKQEESTWTIEDQKEIYIQLEKTNKQEWWKNVITTHPPIDTTKIQPENSKLSDLDGETRSMVEKMMQMGKKTSEELQKEQLLKNFAAQHPELDLSNAKIS